MSLERGTIVAGRYRILERVAQGSFAEIYRAEETDGSSRPVALKLLRGDLPAEEEARQCARLQALEDPALTRVLGHGRLDGGGAAYLALEWVGGVDFLEAARLLSSSELCVVLQQLCRGLDTLHRNGIVHGDLKPANLRVTRRKGTGDDALQVRILGFGLGRWRDAEVDRGGDTLIYAAPEMLRRGPVDGRADLYALGVLLYQAVTGMLPFDASDAAAVLRGHLEETPRPIDPARAGVPAEIAALVTRLLMKDPADRLASATEVANVVAALEPGGAAAPASGALSARELGSPALVGREHDLEALAAFVDCHHRGGGGAGMALLLGEGGIGKSRLLAELADLAVARDLLVHRGFCHETGGAPFGAFLEVLQWAVRTAEREGLRPSSEDERSGGDLIARYGPEVVKVVPGAFACRAVVPSEQLLPRHERLRLIDAIGTFLLEVSLAKPLVLAIEDLHWADDASADLVDYLLRNRARGRLALAASARPSDNRASWLREGLEREAGPGAVLRLALGRLSEEQVVTLLRGSLGFTEPPPELAARVQKDAAGNPFFVVEMLRDLAEDGVLAWRAGKWVCDEPALRKRAASSSITQALERRVARASAEELAVLRALAILDRNIDLEILARVVAAPAPEVVAGTGTTASVSAMLESVIDRGLVARCGGDSAPLYTIAHDSARDLLVRGIDEAARHLLHRAAGLALESRHGTDSEDGIERIAYHFIQAGDDERSARYCMRAAQKARRLYANEDATYFYLQALKYHAAEDDPVRWEALGCLGDVYLVQGKVPHARTRYDEMRRLAEAANDPQAMAASYLGLAEIARRLSDYAEQMRLARAAFGVGRVCALPSVQADALQVLGLAHFDLGHIHKSTRCYAIALTWLPAAGSEKTRAMVLNRLGLALLAQGRVEQAREHFSEALALAVDHNLPILASLHNNLGCLAEQEGLYQDALACYSRNETIATQRGQRYNVALSWLNQSGVLVKLNALAQAEQLARKAIRLAVELGDRLLQGYPTVYRAQIHRLRGELEAAAEHVAEASLSASRVGLREIRLLADLERAHILMDQGELTAAAELAAIVWNEARSHDLRESAAYASVMSAEAHGRRGSQGDTTAALAHAWQALSGRTFPEAEWRTHLVAGKLLDSQGSPTEAAVHYRAGAAIVESIAGTISDEELRASYLREPQRMEMRLKGARALTRLQHVASRTGESCAPEQRPTPARVAAELCRTLATAASVEEYSEALLAVAIPAVKASRGTVICLVAEDSYRVIATVGIAGSTADQTVGPNAPLIDLARARNEAVRASVGIESPGTRADDSTRRGIASAAAVPIPGSDRIWGVLYVDSPETVQFERGDLDLLQLLAAQVGVALEAASTTCQVRTEPGYEASPMEAFGELVAASATMRSAFARLRDAARGPAPVLIEGESGTGKELAARGLHALSAHRSGAFVALDCGAIPETLAEAELFGCVRGAFSGAAEARAGLIASAHGGTLFLDEVGNMPPSLQAKFLRVLQTGEVRALGGSIARRVTFRLVAATNIDLAAEVKAGRFRRDLYYRVAGLVVRLPPLRERPEDIIPIAAQVLHAIAPPDNEQARVLSSPAAAALCVHDWPGNVRELRHVLETASACARGDSIQRADIEGVLRPSMVVTSRSQMRSQLTEDSQRLHQTLIATCGDKSAAARQLGWSRMRIYRVLKRTPATPVLAPD